MKKFFKAFLIFIFFTSNSYSQKVMFIGERGAFFQSLFRNDSRVQPFLSNNLEEAEVIILLQPDMQEAKKILNDKKFQKKKILFAFYYDRPEEFARLPHMYLKSVSEYFDEIDLNQVSNSPFEKPVLSPKVKLAIQYEVWKEVFRHLKLSREISGLIENNRSRDI